MKIGDFELTISTLARAETQLTAAGSILGTPAYASPEQLQGKDLDVRSDIHSVGGTLFHLLTGRQPVRPPPPSWWRNDLSIPGSYLIVDSPA